MKIIKFIGIFFHPGARVQLGIAFMYKVDAIETLGPDRSIYEYDMI